MSLRHLQRVLPSELEYAAHTHHGHIEIDTEHDRAYLTIGAVTLFAELAAETC